jgi:uracil-DNA glycosylase family 4
MIEVNQKEYNGKRLVWGSGPLDAQICFIGTAPGFHEYRVGRPFYERAHAGSKLQEVIHLVG